MLEYSQMPLSVTRRVLVIADNDFVSVATVRFVGVDEAVAHMFQAVNSRTLPRLGDTGKSRSFTQ